MNTRPKPRNKKYAEIEVSQGIHKAHEDFISHIPRARENQSKHPSYLMRKEKLNHHSYFGTMKHGTANILEVGRYLNIIFCFLVVLSSGASTSQTLGATLTFEQLIPTGNSQFGSISVDSNNNIVFYGTGLHIDTAGNPAYPLPTPVKLPQDLALSGASEPLNVALGPDGFLYAVGATWKNGQTVPPNLLRGNPVTGVTTSIEIPWNFQNGVHGITSRGGSIFLAAWTGPTIQVLEVPISDFISGSNTTHVLSCTIPYNIQDSYVITGMTFDNSGFLYMYDANAKNWTGSGSQRAVLKFKPVTMPDPATLEIHFYPGLTITGTVGGAYRIDYSESLEADNWIPLTTITLPSSPYTFSDYTAINAPKRFYRTVGLP